MTLAALSALAVILVALASGLWAGATGAVGGSSAQEFVFSRDSLGSFARSRLPLTDLARIARLPGVAAAGAVGTLTTAMALPHGTVDVALIGTLSGRPGVPPATVSGRLPHPGEDAAAVDVILRSDGVRIGSWLRALAAGRRCASPASSQAGSSSCCPPCGPRYRPGSRWPRQPSQNPAAWSR